MEMDTPDKKAHPSPSSLLAKFEDSPVFNYISNLSPITPYNSSRSAQSFHALSFASPQCLQSSPLHCSDESKSKRATHVSDVLKNDCSQTGSKEILFGSSDAVASAVLIDVEVDKSDSTEEITGREIDEYSEVVTELSESIKNDSVDPADSVIHYATGKLDGEFNVAHTEKSPAKVIEGVSQEAGCSLENEMGVHRILLEGNKPECNWEKFINDASDMLNCQTPTEDELHEELDDRYLDSGTLSFVATVLQPPYENVDGTQKLDTVCPFMSSGSQDVDVPLHQPGMGKSDKTSQALAAEASVLLVEEVVHYSNTQSCSQKRRMTRRRCLVYEMAGAHYRKLQSDCADTTPTSKPSAIHKDWGQGEVASRPRGNKSSSLLPGIGLHLNALAATSRDKIIVKRQTLSCKGQLISSSSTTSSFSALTSDTKPAGSQMEPDTSDMSYNEQKDAVQDTANVDQSSNSGEGFEFHQSSPKKKRRKSENVEEIDSSCKRCNCKRSKCLKLYCECFAAGLYCVEPCNCQDCLNKPIHEETVLETRRQIESRNPLAFAPKVVKCSSTPHHGDELNTPASARHKRGCNCKKSGCLKKYCECFQGGVGCSLSCRCEGCKNTFGRKEGIEIVYEENIFNKCATDAISHNVLATVEENQDQATPEPSIRLRARQLVRRPFQFGDGASQFPSTRQSCTTQKTDRLDEASFVEDIKVAPEDEAPATYALPTCVTSTSPNSKRVSPPHHGLKPSPAPGWKSCRKLILKSISSLPTVIPKETATEPQEQLQ